MPRAPGEAMGAICALTHTDGRRMTCNVEYNHLDALLKGTVNPAGDVADDSGMLYDCVHFVHVRKEECGIFPSNFMFPHGAKTVMNGTRWSIITWLM